MTTIPDRNAAMQQSVLSVYILCIAMMTKQFKHLKVRANFRKTKGNITNMTKRATESISRNKFCCRPRIKYNPLKEGFGQGVWLFAFFPRVGSRYTSGCLKWHRCFVHWRQYSAFVTSLSTPLYFLLFLCSLCLTLNLKMIEKPGWQ